MNMRSDYLMDNLDYLSELENIWRKTNASIRQRVDKEQELLPLLDDVPLENKEWFETRIQLLLWKLEHHHKVWSKVLNESKRRPHVKLVK